MLNDDFRQRTFQYGIRCVRLTEALPGTLTAQTIGKQLLRSGTSVGANYRAAVRSRSRSEFIAKMGIVEEECDETLYWLEMLNELGIFPTDRTLGLYREGAEILSITISSIKTAKHNAQSKPESGDRRPES